MALPVLMYHDDFPHLKIYPTGSGANGELDARYGFVKGFNYFFTDPDDNQLTDVIFERYPYIPPTTYDSGVIDGWPQRRIILNIALVDLWDNTGRGTSVELYNPPPPSGTLSFINVYPNSFTCSIDPYEPIDEYDFSGHYWWIDPDGGDQIPDEIAATTHGLNSATIFHGLDATGEVSVWYSTVDTFSDDTGQLHVNGPFPAVIAGSTDLGTPDNLELSVSGFRDDYNNEHNALVAEWDRATGDLTIGYDLMLVDSSGVDYHFNVAQVISGEKPKYVWTSPVPDRDYNFRLRGYAADGRRDNWTEFSSPAVNVPKDDIEFLHVKGKSRFEDVTYVDVSSSTEGGAFTLDCSQSNIFSITLSSNVTIGVSNVQHGATYLFVLNGSSDANFTSSWYFPESQQLPISVDGTYIISAVSSTSGSLHAVYNGKFVQAT